MNMKTIIAFVTILIISMPAMAHDYHRDHNEYEREQIIEFGYRHDNRGRDGFSFRYEQDYSRERRSHSYRRYDNYQYRHGPKAGMYNPGTRYRRYDRGPSINIIIK